MLHLVAWFLSQFSPKSRKVQRLQNSDQVEINDDTAGELKLLTYNIAGLPQIISSADTDRSASIERIGAKLNIFDIVNVQEDFNYHKYLYRQNQHAYRTVHLGKIPFGDGLSTLSRFPILYFERVSWTDCTGTDCLTPKGFTYAQIQLAKEVVIDVYNVHATSQNTMKAAKARQKNVMQLMQFIQKQTSNCPLLIMGDFNGHYAFEHDNIRHFQEDLGLADAWVNIFGNGIYPSVLDNFQAKAMLELTDNCESIDKIFYKGTEQIEFVPKSYKVERSLFTNELGEDLSDHLAISMVLSWHVRDKKLL